ncbi:MAG: hypothetical protein CMJ64_16325 [Planctomycetaceae bacterium]|nr:hypothetical protein [Planctomycetaceae bacterium]
MTRPQQQVNSAGPIECDSRRGAFFHPLVAFDAGGLPLGVAWQKSWARDKIEKELTAKEVRLPRRGPAIRNVGSSFELSRGVLDHRLEDHVLVSSRP